MRCIALAIFALLNRESDAATLDFTPSSTVGPIQHYFEPVFPFGDDEQVFTFGTPSVQLADYDTLRVRVTAPPGEAFRVSYTGQGIDFASLNFYLRYYPMGNGVYSAPWAPVTSASFQFDFVGGGAGSLGAVSCNPYAVPENPGDRFDFSVGVSVTNDFAFTGFTATLRFDNTSVAHANLSNFADSWLSYSYDLNDFSAPDPGQLMTLLPIPEPSPTMLGGVSLLILLRSRHALGFRRK